MIRNLFGGSKCRTVDKLDIFGDNSGKALYRLDGNANDESGNYHGTETAITYGGGVYERGAVANGSSSKLDVTSLPSMGTSNAVSFYINTATTATQGFIEYSNGTNLIAIYHTSTTLAIRVNALLYTVTTTLPKSTFNHIVVSFATDVPTMYLNCVSQALGSVGATAIAGTSGLRIGVANVATVQTYTNGVLDQVRIFNRAITATEVATLYAECVPTSTVDNINPFEDGSLKALYQFNGDATDKTGVYNGTATNVTYGTGKFGQCAVFNGSSSYITTTKTDWTISQSFSFYLKTSQATSGYIFNSTGGTAGVFSFLNYVAGKITFAIAVGGTVGGYHTSTKTINDNVFHHIVFTIGTDGRTVRIWIDGVLDSTHTSSQTNPTTSTIGMRYGHDGGTNYLNGSIDQLRIFNKALTPMEVASLYNETTPLEEPMHSLVDPFKDGSGKALYRLGGNALDESGNFNGTATSITYGAGRFGRAGVFNGSSSWANTSLPSMGTTNSITFWASFSDTTGRAFITYSNGTNMYATFCDSDLSFQFRVNSTWYVVARTFTLNQDYFFAISVSSNVPTIYIDGAVVSATTSVATTVAGTTGMTFGTANLPPTSWHNGKLEQLRFFNRALTAGEVSQLYTEI